MLAECILLLNCSVYVCDLIETVFCDVSGFVAALGQVMLYVDGMNGVIAHNGTVQWLYSLTASKVTHLYVRARPCDVFTPAHAHTHKSFH